MRSLVIKQFLCVCVIVVIGAIQTAQFTQESHDNVLFNILLPHCIEFAERKVGQGRHS